MVTVFRNLGYLTSGKGSALAVLVPIILLALACTTTAVEQQREDSFFVRPSPTLIVKSDGGRISVSPGPEGVIVVHAELQNSSKLDYQVYRDGDGIIIEAKQVDLFRSLSLLDAPSVDLSITAPMSTYLELTTLDGDVEIEGLSASGRISTSKGGIYLVDFIGDVDARTINGDIEIIRYEGNATLKTMNGAVRIIDGVGSFDVRTQKGDIAFAGELAPGSVNGMYAAIGDISVSLAGDPSLRLLATSSASPIQNSLPMRIDGASSTGLSGIVGSGDAELIIQALDGSVSIR